MAPTAASAEIFHVNGVDLVWSERGSGPDGTPTLVLCHGYTGSALDFSLVVDALAADRRVVTLDQRGHGHSTKTGHLEGYTIEQLSADLAAFLEAVGEGPVDLLGHSMGGRVVMGVVLARPDLVRSLVLMDTSAWSFLPPDEEIRGLVHGFINAFDPAGGMPTTLSLGGPEEALIEANTPDEWRKEKDAIFAGMDPYAVKALGGELMGDAADDDRSLRAKLPSITCPTTVIVGEHDHPLVDQAPELAGEVADGRLTVIPGRVPLPAVDARRPSGGRPSRRIWPGLRRPEWRGERRLAAPGERSDRARRHGRRHPAPWRRHMGLGRQGDLGHGRLRPVPDGVEHPRGLGGEHRGGRRPLRHRRDLRRRRERAHHRPPARRRPWLCATGSSSRPSSCRAHGS